MNRVRNFIGVIQALPPRERYLLGGLACLLIVGIAWGINNATGTFGEVVPKTGGIYREGVVGQPRFVNPILAQTNDVDMDLTYLVYSGILRRSPNGILEPDLATSVEVSEDGRTYTIALRTDVTWHDGEPFTAEDVVFTIAAIQNSDTKSPAQPNFQNVEISKEDDYTVRFVLPDPYPPFRESLSIGIIPRHIWSGVDQKNIALAEHNLKPIGTGPFMFSELRKRQQGDMSEYTLSRFDDYHDGAAYLDRVVFEFFADQEQLLDALRKKRIDGMHSIAPSRIADVESMSHIQLFRTRPPQYSAVFFNGSDNSVLSDKTVRKALSISIDREEVIDRALFGEGVPILTPIPLGLSGHNGSIQPPDPDPESARALLDEAGWLPNEDGIREKDGQRFAFTLTTTTWREYSSTAEILAESWEAIGADVSIDIQESTIIQNDVIRPRNYEALLFGHVLSADPDPYVFWHSRFVEHPGLNLSKYNNRDVDKLLEEARTETNREAREEIYRKFQELIAEDMPALFLYTPHYAYALHNSMNGTFMETLPLPPERFNTITTWFSRTKRVYW